MKPSWGNGMTEVIEYTVPEGGMVVWEGPAASQPIGEPPSPNHHLPGGENQIYIPEEYRNYRKPDVLDKFKGGITDRTPIEWKK